MLRKAKRKSTAKNSDFPAASTDCNRAGRQFLLGFQQKTGPQNLSYAVVERPGGTDGDTAQNKLTILYDIPEINVRIKDEAGTPQDVSLRLNIELTRMEDVQIVEGLMPKIVDAVIAHTIELTPDEISGSNGLYWLREELLYRINLIVSPVVVANLNFKAFGIDK